MQARAVTTEHLSVTSLAALYGYVVYNKGAMLSHARLARPNYGLLYPESLSQSPSADQILIKDEETDIADVAAATVTLIRSAARIMHSNNREQIAKLSVCL